MPRADGGPAAKPKVKVKRALVPGLNVRVAVAKPVKVRPVAKPVALKGLAGSTAPHAARTVKGKPVAGPQTLGATSGSTHFAPTKHGGALATIDSVLSGKVTAPIVGTAANALGKIATVTAHIEPLGQVASVLGGGKALNKIVGGGAHDLVDIPANAIPSVYAAGKKAAEGHVGAAAKMIAQPYIDAAKHPGKSLMNHPVGTALLFTGAEGALSRGAGKAMRVSPSKTLRAVASTERAPKVVPGTRLVEQRSYSKDPLVKVAQKAKERGKPQPLMKPQDIKRRVDENFAATEDVRRLHRGQAVEAATKALGKKPTAAVTLHAQNIANSGAELRAYHAQLVQEAQGLEGMRLKANKTARLQVEKAIKSYDPEKVATAADRYTDLVNLPQQRGLVRVGLMDAQRAEKARLIPYAVQKMGARHDGEQLVDHAGKPLSTAAIRAHMEQYGVGEPAYVTHAPNQRGARNFFVPTHEPPRLMVKPRTGVAMKQGTADIHPDVLVEGAARAQGLQDAADGFARFVHEFAQHDAKTRQVVQFKSYAKAKEAADNAVVGRGGEPIKGALPMRPIALNPFKGSKAQLETLLETANEEGHPAMSALHDAQHQALEGHGEGPWTLVPDAAASRMQAHIKKLAPDTGGRLGNLYGSRFRTAVLATSPKWLTGNVAEATLRSAVAHAGPRSYVTGRLALKRLERIDPEAAKLARSRIVGGGNFALSARSDIHLSAEQFSDSRLRPAAQAIGKFWRTPGPKQLAAAWHGYTNLVFNQLNGRLESQFQTAMLGKALRDHPLMSDRVVKLSNKAIDEAARGLRHTNTQVALGREVDRMYGKYGKYSPGQKRAIQQYTPFIPWLINATHFIYWALPKDHPVLTSALASANQASEEWRKQHGLDVGSVGAVPGFLQGSIPTSGGGHLRASRYTPFGALGNEGALGGLGGTLSDSVLPQFSGVLNALKGQDWRGQKLKKGQSAELEAVKSILLGAVPIAGQAVRISQNPGPLADKLRKELDPTWATTGKKPAAKSGGGWGGGSSGGSSSGWGNGASSSSSNGWG